jgi:tRNA(Ile)-lysidine synthase
LGGALDTGTVLRILNTMAMLVATLIDRVAENINRYSMLSSGDNVGVAVSGGADSVVLLHLLHELSQGLEIKLRVLHVNHHLRGAESEGDEQFVRELAGRLGLPIAVGDGTIGEGNLEQEARLARRSFFLLCRGQYGLNRIALGHTRSDQAETVLYRLFRGSGLAGLAGMRFVTPEGFIRPLLNLSREEVRTWATSRALYWREDSTNTDIQFARNRLRNELIPEIRRHLNGNLEAVLACIADAAQDEEVYWLQQIEPLYDKIAKRTSLGFILNQRDFNELSRAVRRRLVRRVVGELKGDLRGIELDHVNRILDICAAAGGHARVIIPGVDVLRSFDWVLFSRVGRRREDERDYSTEVELGREHFLPAGVGRISVKWVKPDPGVCVKFKEEQGLSWEVWDLDGSVLKRGDAERTLRVRNWRPGDQFHRPGHAKAEKIKSLFQEHQVVLWERRHWPVVEIGGEVVWAKTFGTSARWQPSDMSQPFLRILYCSES